MAEERQEVKKPWRDVERITTEGDRVLTPSHEVGPISFLQSTDGQF